jgi:hypothetical protein
MPRRRAHLSLDGDHDGEVTGLGEHVPGICEDGEKLQGVLEAVPDLPRRFALVSVTSVLSGRS